MEEGAIQSVKKNSLRTALLFFGLAIAISWLFWLAPLLNARIRPFPQPLLLFGQFAVFGPMLAAWILLLAKREKGAIRQWIGQAWQWRYPKRWLLAAIFIPIGLTVLALGVKLIIEGIAFTWGLAPVTIPIVIVVVFITGGPLEEFGWRGFALPLLLRRLSPFWASLLLGFVHGLWHLPLHYMPNTVQSSMPFWEFWLVTLAGAFAYTWIYLGSMGSLTAVILYHWTGNVASACLVYWDTELGRWIFFLLQIALAGLILILRRSVMFRKPLARRKSRLASDRQC
jgi:membrane protease YdiL (CAAX protease family)